MCAGLSKDFLDKLIDTDCMISCKKRYGRFQSKYKKILTSELAKGGTNTVLLIIYLV